MGWAPPSRAAIGGRWAISLPGYAVLVVLFCVPRVLSARTGADSGRIVAAALCAMAVGGLVLLIAHVTLFRNRASVPVPTWWVFALGAVDGGVVGAVDYAVADRPITIIASVALQCALVTPLLAFLFATTAAYRETRQRLLATEVRLEAERMHESGAMAALRSLSRDAEVSGLTEGLRPAGEALRAAEGEPSSGAWFDASTSLRRAAHHVVRPASHRLWSDDHRGQPRRRFTGILTSALRLNPLATWPTVALVALALGSAVLGGWIKGGRLPLAALLIVVSVGVLYLIGNVVLRRTPERWRSSVGAVTIAASSGMAVLITWLLNAPERLVGDFYVGAMIAVAGLVASCAATALMSQGEVIDEIRARISQAEVELAAIRDASNRINRELAQHLHGTVQARLVAAAYAIQDAGRRGDDIALHEAVDEARRTLEMTLGEIDAVGPTTLDSLQQSVAREWQGLLAITWAVDLARPTPLEVDCLDEVLRQALLNSMVHGGAMSVTVQISGASGTDIAVKITDDGVGPRGGPPGLGTKSLNSVTAGNWALEPAPAGTGAVLTATIPRA
jgi:hypothetical protein